MPVIRQYNNRVANVGPGPRVQVSGRTFGSQQAQATAQLGQALSQTGQVIAQQIEQKEVSDINAKVAQKNAEMSLRLQETVRKTAPGDTAPYEKFREDLQNEFDALGDEISTPRARNFLNQASARISGQLTRTSITAQAESAGIKAMNDYRTVLNSVTAAAAADPSSIDLQRDLHAGTIQNLVESGQISANDGAQLISEGELALARSTLRGWATLDPEYAKQKLDSGEFDKELGSDGKRQVMGEINQAVRAREAEEARRRRQQQDALKEQQGATQNKFLEKMVTNNLSNDEILRSNLPAFGSGSKEQFIRMMKKNAEAPLRTDNRTYIALFDRINLPENDPNRLTDEGELNQALIDGKLTFQDLQQLRKEFQGLSTQEGKTRNELKKNFLNKFARGKIVGGSLFKGTDPIAEQSYQAFLVSFNAEYEARVKAGEKPEDLLNPENKNSMTGLVDLYTRSITQQVRDRGLALRQRQISEAERQAQISGRLEAAEQKLRKPEESAAEYLKRMRGGN